MTLYSALHEWITKSEQPVSVLSTSLWIQHCQIKKTKLEEEGRFSYNPLSSSNFPSGLTSPPRAYLSLSHFKQPLLSHCLHLWDFSFFPFISHCFLLTKLSPLRGDGRGKAIGERDLEGFSFILWTPPSPIFPHSCICISPHLFVTNLRSHYTLTVWAISMEDLQVIRDTVCHPRLSQQLNSTMKDPLNHVPFNHKTLHFSQNNKTVYNYLLYNNTKKKKKQQQVNNHL